MEPTPPASSLVKRAKTLLNHNRLYFQPLAAPAKKAWQLHHAVIHHALIDCVLMLMHLLDPHIFRP